MTDVWIFLIMFSPLIQRLVARAESKRGPEPKPPKGGRIQYRQCKSTSISIDIGIGYLRISEKISSNRFFFFLKQIYIRMSGVELALLVPPIFLSISKCWCAVGDRCFLRKIKYELTKSVKMYFSLRNNQLSVPGYLADSLSSYYGILEVTHHPPPPLLSPRRRPS